MFGSNPFGQSSNSPFGSPSVFGQNSSPNNNPFAAKPFGSTSPFGSQTGSSIFGGTSTGVFGTPSSSPVFGASSSPAFGSSMPAFGASSSPAFGASSSSFGGSSVFGQKPAFGGFGSTTQSSPFGSSFPQSQPAFGSNPFGSSSPFGSSQPAFGASSTPAFGASSTPAFGATSTPAFGATSTPAFGAASTPAFGATSTPAFGSTSTPTFGNTGSAFGTSVFGSSTPAFGASSTPAFGASSTPAFGASSTPTFGSSSTPAFGSSPAPAFGATSSPFSFGSSPAFGQSTSAFGSSPFSATSTTFGAQSSPFGQQTTTPAFASPGFGQPSFGGQQRGGTRITPYAQTPEADSGSGTQAAGKLESISAMPAYKEKSHEEFRWEDYQLGDKGGPNPAAQPSGGMGFNMNNTQQPNPFASSSPAFGQSSSNPFSSTTSTNPFASKTSTFGPTGFGNSTPALGSSPFATTTSNPFGSTPAALARSKGLPGIPHIVQGKTGVALEPPGQVGVRRRRSVDALLAGMEENEELLLREVTEQPEEHITFETPRTVSPEFDVRETPAVVEEQAVPASVPSEISSLPRSDTLNSGARTVSAEMGVNPHSPLDAGQMGVFSNVPPKGLVVDSYGGEESGGAGAVIGDDVVGGPEVVKDGPIEVGPITRVQSDTYVPLEVHPRSPPVYNKSQFTLNWVSGCILPDPYDFVLPQDAAKYHVPNWTLKQGDYLESAEVCTQFVNGAAPPAESIYQRRRPREEIFRDGNIKLAGLVSTYAEITRDWRELLLSEEERKAELEECKQRVQETVVANTELSKQLATAEADHKAAKAKWQTAWENSNASIEALKNKNQEAVKATEDARSLAAVFEKQAADRADEVESLKARVKELEATVTKATEDKEHIGQVNMDLEQQVEQLTSDRKWLISKGFSGVGYGLLQSPEYIALLNNLVSAYSLVAREKGVREGYAHCLAGRPLETFPLTKERATELLQKQAHHYTYAHHPFLQQFHALADQPDLTPIKALVEFEDLSSPSSDKDMVGPSSIPDSVYIQDEHLDLEDSDEQGNADVTADSDPAEAAQVKSADDGED